MSKRKKSEKQGTPFPGLQELEKEKPVQSISARLRSNFFTGMIIVGPISITIYFFWWFINLVDHYFKPAFNSFFVPFFDNAVKPVLDKVVHLFVPAGYEFSYELPFEIPGLGLVFAIFLVMSIGALAANLFGRTLVSLGERILDRMPVVRNVYGALKQIFETVLTKSSSSFQKVGVIEYPRRGLHAVVFISTDTTGEIAERCDEDSSGLLSVFLPTTPNPTSGFLLFVPEEEVTLLDMSVEEAAKLVISAGLVVPEYQQKLARLAGDASRKGNDHINGMKNTNSSGSHQGRHKEPKSTIGGHREDAKVEKVGSEPI